MEKVCQTIEYDKAARTQIKWQVASGKWQVAIYGSWQMAKSRKEKMARVTRASRPVVARTQPWRAERACAMTDCDRI